MMYATSDNGEKILAHPKMRAVCPACLEPVIAKCGQINIWHWAHLKNAECDSWFEHETPWHMWWKSLFPKEYVEVVIERGGVIHRADVLSNNTIIEFQRSPISPEEVQEREGFYGNMLWVFNVIDAHYNDRLEFSKGEHDWNKPGAYKSYNPNYYKLSWKHPRKTISFVNSTCYLDHGNTHYIFLMKKLHTDRPRWFGWGYFYTIKEVAERFGGRFDYHSRFSMLHPGDELTNPLLDIYPSPSKCESTPPDDNYAWEVIDQQISEDE